MFEYVQEREMGSRQEPQTLFYVITAGEVLRNDPGKLSERGQNQILELANSRLIAGVSKIYSSSTSNGIETAKILAKELDTRMEKKECLDAFNLEFLGLMRSSSGKLFYQSGMMRILALLRVNLFLKHENDSVSV